LLNDLLSFLALETGSLNMNGIYERLYRKHLSSIAQSHPRTATKLHSIKKRFGTHAAYHAAAIIICLQARMAVSGIQAAGLLTEEDLEEFIYFKYMSGNLPALEMLVELLECHVLECQSRHIQSANVDHDDLISVLATS